MPLPWKKAKINRISRLVADLHQSPKRGGSLVVETGFPTSLIDLFVKNQDRWRKSSRRKSSLSPSPSPPGPDPDPQISTPLPSPPNSSSSPTCMQEVGSPVINVGESVLVECEERVSFHPAKVLLVVALAVGTRSLAIWIMMAAFLLVLLEFVGTRFFGFLRPQSLMLFLGSWLQKQKALLVLKKRWWDWEQGSQQELVAQQQQQQEQQQGILLPDSCHGDGDEIQIAESKTDSITVEDGYERISDMLEKSREMSIGKSGRRERIKATLIRKFVPKKLRKANKQGKKKKSQSQEEVLCSDQVDISLEKLEKLNKIEEEDNDESGVQVEVEIEEEESCKEGEGGERCSTCSVQVMALGVESQKEEEKAKAKAVDGKGKSGSKYLIVIVIGMVLAGLLEGRGLSLLLTLVCCLVATYLSSSSSTAVLSRVLSQSQSQSQGRKLSLD